MSALTEDASATPTLVRRRTMTAGPERDDDWLIDLLVPFETARRQAIAAAARQDWLDAALLAAGCGQVVEDHVHRSERLADRIVAHLSPDDRARRIGRAAAGVAADTRRELHRRRPAVAKLLAHRDRLLELTVALAAASVDAPLAPDRDTLAAEVVAVLGLAAPWPGELDEVPLRLPSSFRSFDQHPADMASLARSYVERGSPGSGPVVVVGIRTSGSYLGPFVAAELRRLGVADVSLVTLRPDERLDPVQSRLVARPGTSVVVVDDPPVSGDSIAGCVDEIAGAGTDRSRITLLLAMPAGADLPTALASTDAIVLPRDRWHIPEVFGAEATARTVEALLAADGRRLVGPLEPSVDPVGPTPGGAPRTSREHGRAAFAARIAEADGTERDLLLIVQGAGIGLFGRHDAAVARRLPGLVPEVLGVVDGVLHQLVAPAGHGTAPAPEVAARYVLARHEALRVDIDRSASMSGRKAGWEIASMIVGGALGPADVALRLTLVQGLVRDLLSTDRPSVVDGRMTADRWLRPAGLGAADLVKTEWGDGAFSNRDLWSYDAVYDLAAIADAIGAPEEVRRAWTELGGDPVEPSRWLLQRLVAAWDRHRLGGLPQPDYGRRMGDALAQHVGDLFLADLTPGSGPWCAIDLDGVLETGVLSGASAPGTCGAMALRGLLAHGHRVIVATGRSAGEAAVRRAAWHLPAAVAEYGCGLVLPTRTVDLRDDAGRDATERARAWLAEQPDVTVDHEYRLAVRAWLGTRRPLTQELIDGAIAAAGGSLTMVPGEAQTDFMPAGVSKVTGVRAALERLDPAVAAETRPLAFAVGDGPADMEMLGLAELPWVPAHASADVRAASPHESRRSYQAGLEEGVGRLLGHAPSTCPTCAVAVEPRSAALMRLLSVREAGPRAIPGRLAGFATSVARLSR